jgi:hypothetical protein
MTFIEDALARFSDAAAMGEVALELRARWHRAFDEYHGTRTDTTFVQGRLTGISTSLALLLGVEHKALHKMLMDEHISVRPR